MLKGGGGAFMEGVEQGVGDVEAAANMPLAYNNYILFDPPHLHFGHQ